MAKVKKAKAKTGKVEGCKVVPKIPRPFDKDIMAYVGEGDVVIWQGRLVVVLNSDLEAVDLATGEWLTPSENDEAKHVRLTEIHWCEWK